MSDHEIDLSTGLPNSDAQDNRATAPPSDAMPEIHAHAGVIPDLVTPGMSGSDLVDALITAPKDKLIPWESIELPSRGLYYGWTTGVISVRGFGANTDRIMATQRLAQSGQTLTAMFEDCCRFPEGFDINQMLVGDQMFLLYYIRGITHGEIYEFSSTCANCGATNMHEFNLNELGRTITYANPLLGSEPFPVVLPYMSQITGREFTARVRFLRVGDATNITKLRRAQNANSVKVSAREKVQQRIKQHANRVTDLDDSLIRNMESIIVDIMGVQDKGKIRAMVDRMHQSDLSAIRDWLDEHTPSIDPIITIKCPECNDEAKTALPLTESFFRPKKQRGSGA